MSDAVERVARAICVQANLDDGYAYTGTLHASIEQGMWRNHVNQARAAIAALREPTDAMILLGAVEGGDKPMYRDVWRAMIDAALDDG